MAKEAGSLTQVHVLEKAVCISQTKITSYFKLNDFLKSIVYFISFYFKYLINILKISHH